MDHCQQNAVGASDQNESSFNVSGDIELAGDDDYKAVSAVGKNVRDEGNDSSNDDAVTSKQTETNYTFRFDLAALLWLVDEADCFSRTRLLVLLRRVNKK